MSQLLEILKAEGRRITEEFRLASEQGDGTSQEIADFRENAVQDFISRFYPASHIVSKGKITDLEGVQSNSIDCLVLNPAHPNLIDAKGKFRLIFADGCDAAIEVKPDLARTDELHRALEQGISVKKTKRSKSPLLLPLKKRPHILEHSLHIPFYIFAVKSFDPPDLYEKILKYYNDNGVCKEQQLDGVCIINVGILKNIKHKELNFYSEPPPIGQNEGWYLEAWGESTPLGLLLSLEHSYPSFPNLAEPIMKRLLKKIGKTQIRRLGDGI
ncbi:MAG: DUF6602 domain-containing protein [Thermodesulfobacteriota bacterium]|jgi:hypothetical protein